MNDILEMAQGNLTRVIAVRLRPGTDVLQGLTEACRRAGINNGVILSAIGSLDGVAYCNPVELPDKKAGYGYGEVLHLYLARDLTFGATHPDADEFLQVRRLPFDTLLARCLSGEIEDGKTVAAVLKAKLLGL